MDINIIKRFCSEHKLKFEKFTENGFIASQYVKIRAGMEYIHGNNELVSIPIRTIGRKKVSEKFVCFTDGDIVGYGKA